MGQSPRTQAEALRHGDAVHMLLERLAAVAPEARGACADRVLGAFFPEFDRPTRDAAVAEASSVFAAPFAGLVFGPGSTAEATLALRLAPLSDMPLIGRIDRLVVMPDDVLIIDFKTDTRPPDNPASTPRSYLAQLAAYAAGARDIWPSRRVGAAILWSTTPALMHLPDTLLRDALAAAERTMVESAPRDS